MKRNEKIAPFWKIGGQSLLVKVDAKILSRALATMIKNVLPDVVHHNQSSFVKNRYIGATVRSIFDLMDFTLKRKHPRSNNFYRLS